jgi:predicted transcriptional regulator
MKREILANVAAEIVTTYLSNHKVPVADMNVLVGGVCDALNGLRAPPAGPPPRPVPAPPQPPAPQPRRWMPVVAVRDSVRPDALVCLMCGKELLTLRRHLGNAHRLLPDEYRERFNLPDTYPMDAADYTEVRRKLANERGLGKQIQWPDRPPADPDRRRPSSKKANKDGS